MPSLLFWVRGKDQSPRGPKGREQRWGSCGGGSQLPVHRLGGLGSAVSSPSAVRVGTLAAERFSGIPQAPEWPILELVGGQVRAGGMSPPLNPPMTPNFVMLPVPMPALAAVVAGQVKWSTFQPRKAASFALRVDHRYRRLDKSASGLFMSTSWHVGQCRIKVGAIDAAALGPFKK